MAVTVAMVYMRSIRFCKTVAAYLTMPFLLNQQLDVVSHVEAVGTFDMVVSSGE